VCSVACDFSETREGGSVGKSKKFASLPLRRECGQEGRKKRGGGATFFYRFVRRRGVTTGKKSWEVGAAYVEELMSA